MSHLGMVLSERGTSGIDLLERLLRRPAWHARAACRGRTDLFFVEGKGAATVAAVRDGLALCAGCPVTAECAEAGRGERHGTWGGLTASGRRKARSTAA